MKKKLLLCLASLAVVAPVSGSFAQQTAPEKTQNASPEVQEALGDLENPNSALGKTASAFQSQLSQTWSAKSQSLIDQLSKQVGPGLHNSVDRYRLGHTFGLENKLMGQGDGLLVDANYQIVVEPGFRSGEQIRRDIYVFGLGAVKGLSGLSNEKVAALGGGKMQVRVTFSRVFTGKDAKLDAIRALPYFLNKLPLSADGVKEKMQVGDTLRVEILGNMSAGVASTTSQSIGTTGVGAGYTREGLFMLDIYRHSLQQVRVRLFGLKNRGTFSVSAATSLTPWNSLIGTADNLVTNKIRKSTEVGLDIGLSKTADLFHDFPIDTMMLDYLFALSSDKSGVSAPGTSEAAMNELLANVRQLGSLPLFNLFAPDKDLAQMMKARARLSEQMAREDFGKGSQARVRHLFKGRITSTVTTVTLGASASSLIGKARNTISLMRSFVRAEDSLDRQSFYLLESSSNNTEARALLGRSSRTTLNDVDVLMKSNEQKKVIDFMDIVTTTEIRDKNFEQKELMDTRTSLMSTLPSSLQTPEVSNFLPQKNQKNAYFRSRFTFGTEAFGALHRLSQLDIAKALYKYLDTHPKKQFMHLPEDLPTTGPSFTEYVESLATLIHQAVGPDFKEDQRLAAFHLLIRDPIFQKYLIGEFFTSLLPSEESGRMASVSLQFSSEQTPAKDLNLGKNQVSDVYRLVSFLRSVLNNRSYDLRLETQINEDGSEVLVTPEIKGFNMKLSEDFKF